MSCKFQMPVYKMECRFAGECRFQGGTSAQGCFCEAPKGVEAPEPPVEETDDDED